MVRLLDNYTFFLANCDPEKILKKLVGKTDVEDALSRLDMLTKEESLMVVLSNLEVAHHIDDNVQATRVIAHSVDNGTQHSCLSSCAYRPLSRRIPT